MDPLNPNDEQNLQQKPTKGKNLLAHLIILVILGVVGLAIINSVFSCYGTCVGYQNYRLEALIIYFFLLLFGGSFSYYRKNKK